MERIEDGYKLSSGRTFYANRGLVSLTRDRDGSWEIGEGYDGHIAIHDSPWDPTDKGWTAEERAELAAYMIQQWAELGDLQVDFGPSWARPVGING